MAKLRTCKICGKQYEYCGHCPNKNLIEPWRNLYCSEDCCKAFEVMSQYAGGKISAIDAKTQLEICGISPVGVRDVHKAVVSDIFRASKPEPKIEIEVNPTIETTPIAEEVKSTVEEKPIYQKPFKKKQRRVFEDKKNIVNED